MPRATWRRSVASASWQARSCSSASGSRSSARATSASGACRSSSTTSSRSRAWRPSSQARARSAGSWSVAGRWSSIGPTSCRAPRRSRWLRSGGMCRITRSATIHPLRASGRPAPVTLVDMVGWSGAVCPHAAQAAAVRWDMVTSRRTAAEQPGGTARAAAEQFRLLVESVRDYAIFLLDREGGVASWNGGAERIKGSTPAEILGEHFSRFYTPEDVAAGKPARALATAVREGRFEARGWRGRKDGSRLFAPLNPNALPDEQGRLTGFAKITQDVTAEREAEQTLRERERQLEQAQSVARLGSFEWDLASDQVSGSPELSRILGLAHAPLATT